MNCGYNLLFQENIFKPLIFNILQKLTLIIACFYYYKKIHNLHAKNLEFNELSLN